MMENLLRNGDYVPDGFGGFVRLHGEQQRLARALFRLTCRLGAFPFLPTLGSRLFALGKEKPSVRAAAARQYAEQALDGMDYAVTDAAVSALPDGFAEVTVQLSGGQTLEVRV